MSPLLLTSSPLVLLSFLLLGTVLGDELRISTADGLVNFSNSVNNGDPFRGTTVYLDSDIDLSRVSFVPIGDNVSNYFVGTFDGQGFLISGLTEESNNQYTGLFGNSNGGTIRNVILDYSCTLTNSFNATDGISDVCMGGIIGSCTGYENPCVIENCVNMATFTFNGDTDKSKLLFGGIAGYLKTSKIGESTIKNCVNYGFATYSGKSSTINVGGILGRGEGLIDSKVKIKNCQNYGNTRHTGTVTKNTDFGGIAGYGEDIVVKNCVNTKGTNSNYTSNTTGNIIGYVKYGDFYACYWTSESKLSRVYGKREARTNITNSYSVEINETILSALNEYASENRLNRWVLNEEDLKVLFYLNGKKSFDVSSQLIILQDLARNKDDNDVFSGWFTDSTCTTPFDSTEIIKSMSLYGGLNYTVQFDATGGVSSEDEKTVTRGSIYGNLPWAVREGENQFLWWYIYDSGEMTKVTPDTKVTKPTAHTLCAAWEINIVTFDFGNGTKTSESVRYDKIIVYPENPVRDGYAFSGWDVEIETTQGRDVTITALWNETNDSGSMYDGRVISYDAVIAFGILLVVVFTLSVSLIAIYIRNRMKADKKISPELDELLDPSDHDKDENYVRSDMTRLITNDGEEEEDAAAGKALNTLYKVYPPDYTRPTMKEALINADLCEADANEIVESCYNATKFVVKDNKLFDDFTEDDAAALAMYTYDFGSKKFEHNPYRIINRSLVERNFNNLRKASGLLYIMMTALRKLPRVTGISLYRGVRSDVNLDREHYREGNIITWSALSSSSPDMKSIKTFLAKVPKRRKVTGTLFIIEDGWGYDIQPYSLFPGEAEILIEPDRQFKVRSVIQTESINIINLIMLDTPLALPQVFGEGKKTKDDVCDSIYSILK